MRAHIVDPRQVVARPCEKCRRMETSPTTTWARRGGLCSACYHTTTAERLELEARRARRRV